ncbi:MAG: DUF885 domain-containing protein [Gemmatimonadota bacterium]
MPRLFAVMALLLVCGQLPAQDAPQQARALFDEYWQYQLRENPLQATSIGDHRYNDRLPGMTLQDITRRVAAYRALLTRVNQLQPASLSADDRISYDMMKLELEVLIEGFEVKRHLMPLLVDDGFHIAFAFLPSMMPFQSTRDYENYITRLRAFPVYANQHIELMRDALKAGFSLPRVILDGYELTISSHVVDDPAKSLFWKPFMSFPVTVPQGERARLTEDGRQAIKNGVVAGYRSFLQFYNAEYLPGARSNIGASTLPNGTAYYRNTIREFTTLDLTPDSIHRIGLAEVARIRAEMDDIIAKVGFRGSFAEFLNFLRTDSRFYATTPEQLLKEAAWIAKRMDGKLPALFGRLPRAQYSVAPVPDHIAPKYTAGRYIGTSPGSTEPGYYWVNTYNLTSRPLYALEALTLHEAVPGHHMQISLAQELEGVPDFRRNAYLSAFGEGWGLYSERLGLEAGFFTDPYSNFGRLTYEMWRACRLVIDTGIHSKGWSRQQALDYMASNTALSLHEVRTEIDRYIAWPGQALAYKLGELKIRELRQRAERELGSRFDLREFHDEVLGAGSIPLGVLERRIVEWINRKRVTSDE